MGGKKKRSQKRKAFERVHSKLLTVVAPWGIEMLGNKSAGE